MNKPLTKKLISAKIKTLDSNWALATAGTSISRKFLFPNYISGLIFVTKVSVHAEVVDHHPEITLGYGFVKVVLTTKDVKGLSLADFALATTIDTLYELSTKKKINVHKHY